MIFELSKENLDLAREEVLALSDNKEFKMIKNLLILDAELDYKRLAFTNNVFENIFVSDKIEDIDWQKHYKENFCVRCNITNMEKELAKIIWENVKDPKVKLKNSSSEFHFFFINDKVVCGKLLYKRKEKFHLRRPDLRPGFFPVSLKPKLARSLVNLSGVKEGTIWDPFCGTGGMLLEASLMGLKILGSDVDPLMIKAAKDNFKKYKLEANFYIADARKEKVECDAIVTDPPYGRRASLKKLTIQQLYEEFLDNVYDFVDTVVLMLPNDLKFKSKFKIVFQTDEYVHASLTRRILVMKK
jgi:tRNA (guanine10-N2)-dimethyltransferase